MQHMRIWIGAFIGVVLYTHASGVASETASTGDATDNQVVINLDFDVHAYEIGRSGIPRPGIKVTGREVGCTPYFHHMGMRDSDILILLMAAGSPNIGYAWTLQLRAKQQFFMRPGGATTTTSGTYAIVAHPLRGKSEALPRGAAIEFHCDSPIERTLVPQDYRSTPSGNFHIISEIKCPNAIDEVGSPSLFGDKSLRIAITDFADFNKKGSRGSEILTFPIGEVGGTKAFGYNGNSVWIVHFSPDRAAYAYERRYGHLLDVASSGILDVPDCDNQP